MNFLDMQRRVLWERGRTDDSLVQDWERQLCRDHLNESYHEIMSALRPYYWKHMKRGSITTVSGTEVYTLADDCLSPVGFWIQDTQARPINYVDPLTMDETGFRNSNLSLSYVDTITWYQDTQTAATSGVAGSSEGATVSSGSTALTKAGGTAWTSADVGKIIRLNNEFESEIAAVGGADACTLSRAYRGRLSGDDDANSATGLTEVMWEVTPPGRCQIEIPQTLSNTEEVFYRYVSKAWPMVSDTDLPDRLPIEKHNLVVWGALLLNAADREKQSGVAQKYERGLFELKEENRAAIPMETRIYYEANSLRYGMSRPFPVGTDFRANRGPGRRM